MPATFPFNDEQNGAEIREKLNAMWADWLEALETAVGKDGWSPLLRTVTDGARQVIELYDWVGGSPGAKPTQTGYMGPAGFVTDIALAINFRGDTGNNGANGWSPLLRTVADGERQAIQLYDWSGGTGTKPAIAGFMGATGLVENIADGINFRGMPGLVGPANSLGIGVVTTGSPDEDAAASVDGVYPNQKLNLLIPAGAPGAVSTITVGTVTTGEPGTEVQITPRGTPTGLILDFVIPRGDPGEGDGDMLKSVYDQGNTGSVKRANAAPWSGIEDKPAVIAAGLTAAEAREAIDLGNVDNTADADKPVSTQQAQALGDKVDKVAGKDLSSNDYTATDKQVVGGVSVALAEKQDGLVSGENIKTVNGESLLGSGDVLIESNAYQIGDIHTGPSNPTTGSWLACGNTYMQASYPELMTKYAGIFGWSPGKIPSGDYQAIVETGSNLVAVGDSVCARSSADGIYWTAGAMPTGQYYAIARIGSTLIAVGTNVCATSATGGSSWTARTIPAGTYIGLVVIGSTLVAVGSSVCATSADNGVTWTARTIPAGSYSDVTQLAGVIVAVGQNVCATSSNNGVTWTARTIPAGVYRKVSPVGSTLAAVGDYVCATSADGGVSWTPRNIPSGIYFGLGLIGSRLIAIGNSVSAASGDNGATWYSVGIPAAYYRSVAVLNYKVYAVGLNALSVGIEGLKTSAAQFTPPQIDYYYPQWIKAND